MPRSQEELDFDYEKEEWRWVLPDRPSQQEFYGLFLREDFLGQLADCIKRSERISESMIGRAGLELQEFGFFAYTHNMSERGHIYLSQVIEGEERTIKMDRLYLPKNLTDPNKDNDLDVILDIHTHPSSKWLINEIFNVKGKYALPSSFSLPDLKYIKHYASEQPFTIFGIAIRSGTSRGQLLLVSFRDYDSYAKFDPVSIWQEYKDSSKDWKKRGKNYSNAVRVYRTSGLNVAIINIRLGDKPRINEKDALKASRILARVHS